MSAQLSYGINIPKGYHGSLYGVGPRDVISRGVEGAAGIGFGIAVSRGTDKERQALPGGIAADFLGLSIRSLEREGAANTGAIKYSEKETAGILRTGYIQLICPAGCTAGDSVKYNSASGVVDAGSAGAGEVQLTNAQWETTTVAGELGLVSIEVSTTQAGA